MSLENQVEKIKAAIARNPRRALAIMGVVMGTLFAVAMWPAGSPKDAVVAPPAEPPAIESVTPGPEVKPEPDTKPAPKPKVSPEQQKRFEADVIATTQSLIRDRMKNGKTVNFLPGAVVGKIYDKFLVKGDLTAEQPNRKRKQLPYEAIILIHAETAEVELWSVEVGGQDIFMSEEAEALKKFMDENVGK